MGNTNDDITTLAVAAATVAMKTWEERERKMSERIYTVKSIAVELEMSTRNVWRLVKDGKLPLDEDPRGYSVLRWELQRWLASRRRQVEQFQNRAKSKKS